MQGGKSKATELYTPLDKILSDIGKDRKKKIQKTTGHNRLQQSRAFERTGAAEAVIKQVIEAFELIK